MRLGRDMSQTMGIGVSVIQENTAAAADQSEFFSMEEANDLFGQTEFKPDKVLIPREERSNSKIVTADNMDNFNQMNGEFKIERGFSGMDRAQYFQVFNPEKAQNSDHIQYSCVGICRYGKF